MASGSQPDVGRRARLRSETATAHQRVDDFVEEAGFLAARGGYVAYVAATWQARSPLERMLDDAGAAEVFPDWPHRRLAAALEEDLRDLGATPTGGADAGQAPFALPDILGTLYVLEGSALGARLIERRLDGIGVGPSHGARHIARQTADPRAWRRFVDVLDAAALTPADEDRCAAAARATFAAFERCYREALAIR